MRSCFPFFSILVVLVLLESCQTNIPTVEPTLIQSMDSTLSITEARQIYDSFLQQKTVAQGARIVEKNGFEKKLQWQYAQKEKFTNGTEVVLVPLDTKVDNFTFGLVARSDQSPPNPTNTADMHTVRKAVIYRQKGKEYVEFVTIVGEQFNKEQIIWFSNDRDFTGAMLFHDDDGNFLRGFYYDKGRKVATLGEQSKDKNARRQDCEITINYTINSYFYTVTVRGYGTTNPIYNFSYGQITSYFIVCDPSGGDSNSPATSVGGSSDGSAWTFDQAGLIDLMNSYAVSAPPNSVNPRDHLRCFYSNTGSSYQIFMNVDQPISGSTSPIGSGGPDKHVVGHAFLTFQQTQPNGQIIRRSIGFYPAQGGGNVTSPTAPPAFNDDSQYSGGWDVQLQFSVSGSEFMQAINMVYQYANSNYDLFSRNCSNMCRDALQQAGITNLPTGIQSWGAVSPGSGASTSYPRNGVSIGLLGEQLYNYQSSKIISRSHSGGGVPANAGTCN